MVLDAGSRFSVLALTEAETQPSCSQLPRVNFVMDSALACFAGGPGSVPAVGKSKKLQYSDCFFSLLA